jgi:ubiquitin carboxyl-terminal hydrolase 7
MSAGEQTEANSLLSSNVEASVELKKRKSLQTQSSIDFSFLSDQILPKVEDEEVIDIGSYTWEIKDYKSLSDDKVRGPVFKVGGWDFNVLLFPKGNANNNIALYLEPLPKTMIDETSGEVVPVDPKWYVCVQFTLIISNPREPKNCIVNTSHQRFCKYATDWGFSNFTDIRSLYQARRELNGPLMYDDKLNITAFVKVLKDTTGVLWHNFLDYDSKKQTGFVGFKNQGATCYLNSLLQSYFFTKSFRKAVYQIPTERESPTDSVPLALQRIFYQLQRSDEAIDTLELTKSFGWDTGDAFTQHDVQELNRILMDRLEARMKGTPVENVLNKTFVGKMKSYIKCINVDYESSRIEDFWDIQLNVKDLSNLTESFQNYVEVEVMDGENQYMAQDFGLQDARKGVVFTEFPTVLHLQLKRFEYDFNYDSLVKINDRHEFPESIDLSPFLEKSDGPCIYDLHGVLVHSGDISTGHYYAMIKPDKSDKWYRFDDDRVWRVTKREAFEANFGLEPLDQTAMSKMTRAQVQNYQIRRHTSAYMLVYIKRSERDNVLQEVTQDDVPKFISSEVDKELDELATKRKELEELHLYLNINFFTNDLFKRYEGFDLSANERFNQPDLYTEKDYPYKIKALKTKKFNEFYPEIREKLGVDPEKVTFWGMSYRRNQTLRPNSPLEIGDMTVEELYSAGFSKKYSTMNIWVEQPEQELFSTVPTTLKSRGKLDFVEGENVIESTKILLFLKYFDVDEQTLRGVTHIVVNEEDPIESIVPAIRYALSISDEYEVKVFEEVNQGSVDLVNLQDTFYKSELGSGDILCVQKATPTEGDLLSTNEKDTYPIYRSADEYYSYLASRIHVKVQALSQPSDDDEFVLVGEDPEDEVFDMWISSVAPYDELATRIGRLIKKDPNRLRIFANYNGHRYPLHSKMNVSNMLPRNMNYGFVPLFEYELLNIALKQLENMKAFKVHWLTSGYCHYTDYEFLIENNGNLSDLIDKMQAKIGFSDKDKESVLLWTNQGSKFGQVVFPTTEIGMLEGDGEIYGAVLPEEKKILQERYFLIDDEVEVIGGDELLPKLVPVLQFYKDARNLHGISFIIVLNPDETLAQTKERLQKKMGLGQKEFAKAQICMWDLIRRGPLYFTDDDVVLYDELTEQDFLCIDLPDRTSRIGTNQSGGISIR